MYSDIETVEIKSRDVEALKRDEIPGSLDILFDYLMKEKKEDPLAFKRSDKISLFLELLGGSGGIYAWPSAKQYAENMPLWLSYSFQITNPLSNILFLMKATDNLFDTIQLELQSPTALDTILIKPETRNLVLKYIKMGIGSTVCVIPFGLAVYLFPLPNCSESWCLGLTISHSILTNTILHAVSWNLILSPEFWYYRLPVIPFEFFYKVIKEKCTDRTELAMLDLVDKQEMIYTRYKNRLSQAFGTAGDRIIRGVIKGESVALDNLKDIQNTDLSFVQLISQYRGQNRMAQEEKSFFRKMTSTVDSILTSGSIGFFGANIMCIGCLGWIANPFYIGSHAGLELWTNVLAGSLPAYSTAILCAFYGSHVFNQIYQYMTNWPGFRDKFSYEVQMYPKTFAAFLLINLYISFFSYATACQLIETVFEDEMWKNIRPALEWITIPTLQLLSFIPLLDLFNLVIRKFVAKFGDREKDETLAARLMLKLPLFDHYLQQMKGNELMESIQRFSEDEQRIIGFEPEDVQHDIAHLKDIDTRIENLRQELPVRISSSQFSMFSSAETRAINENTYLSQRYK